MLENELDTLKRRHDENKRTAYANIVNSYVKNYKNELEIILDYFKIDYNIEYDTFEKQLNEIKNKYDISYRIITLGDGWYQNSMQPLLVRENNTFKAVIPDFKGKCYCYANNKKVPVLSKNADKFDSNALCFYKGFGIDKISRLSLIKFMLKCISFKEYAVLIISIIAVMLFSTVMPQAQYYIFNNLIPTGIKFAYKAYS